MSLPITTKEKTERKYTSIACLECRKRKVKCNNARPRCTNCTLYNVDCVFGEDRRRSSETTRQRASMGATAHWDHFSPPLASPLPPEQPTYSQQEGDTHGPLQSISQHAPDLPLDSHSLDLSYRPSEWEADPLDRTGLSSTIDVTDELDHSHSLPLFSPNFPFGLRENPGISHLDVFMQVPDTIATCQDPSLYTGNGSGTQNGWTEQELTVTQMSILPPSEPMAVLASSVLSSTKTNVGLRRTRPTELEDDHSSSVDGVTKQLTSRLGRLQITQGGHSRYYGATSNLHILHSGFNSLVQPNIRNVFVHGDAAIIQAGLEWPADPSYEDHLISLFFSWHNTLMHVVDRDIFLEERRRYRERISTDLYSPALENAVYAIASAYTDRSHAAVPDATDEFFAFRAKTYIEIEIDCPTIATAQALLILSAHEAAHARESRGWIYSGMAVQIMTDLGLHLDLHGELSQLETSDQAYDQLLNLRRNLFWSTNTIDTLWSAHCGRPSLMKGIIHNLKAPCPSPADKWIFYIDDYSSRKFPAEFDFAAASLVHIHLASLMTVLARVSQVLYSGVPGMFSDIESFVSQSDTDFQNWFHSLPPRLQLDTSGKTAFYVPAVMELHLSYHECIILLHRPLISPEDTTETTLVSPTSSLNHCLVSAREICKILTLFRRAYGLRRPHHLMVHVTMTAALIHIFQLCVVPGPNGDTKEAQQDLLTCIQALGEMGQTYKSASRALDVVTALRQSWQDNGFASDRFKRAKLG